MSYCLMLHPPGGVREDAITTPHRRGGLAIVAEDTDAAGLVAELMASNHEVAAWGCPWSEAAAEIDRAAIEEATASDDGRGTKAAIVASLDNRRDLYTLADKVRPEDGGERELSATKAVAKAIKPK